jgi:hypothetical protein
MAGKRGRKDNRAASDPWVGLDRQPGVKSDDDGNGVAEQVLKLAGSNIDPGSSQRAVQGRNAPINKAPANWNRLRTRIEPLPAR